MRRSKTKPIIAYALSCGHSDDYRNGPWIAHWAVAASKLGVMREAVGLFHNMDATPYFERDLFVRTTWRKNKKKWGMKIIKVRVTEIRNAVH